MTRDEPPADATFALSELEIYALHATHNALFTFTAPGDDEYDGFADIYRLKGSTDDPFSFENALEFETESPSIGGSLELIPVSELATEETYHFAVQAEDDAGNLGEVSTSAPSSSHTTRSSPRYQGSRA